MAVSHAEYFEQPTWEHDIPELDWDAELKAGVFNDTQLAVLKDPDTGELEKLEAIGQALHDDQNSDFRNFLKKNLYKVDPDNALDNLDSLFSGAAEYARAQEAIQSKLQEPEFLEFLTPHEVRQLAAANIEDKQELTGTFSSDFLDLKSQVEQLQAMPGLTDWMAQSSPARAQIFDNLPLNDRRNILLDEQNKLAAYRAEIERCEQEKARAEMKQALALQRENEASAKQQQLMEAETALDSYLLKRNKPVDVVQLLQSGLAASAVLGELEAELETSDYKKYAKKFARHATGQPVAAEPAPKPARQPRLQILKEAEQNSGVTLRIRLPNPRAALKAKLAEKAAQTKTEWDQLPLEAKRKVALASSVVALAMSAGIMGDVLGEPHDKAPGGAMGEAVPGHKVALHLPSELAHSRFHLASGDNIPERERRAIIVRGGRAFARGRVGNLILKMGHDNFAEKDETAQTVRKIDMLALTNLSLLTHRPNVTPRLADEVSNQASNLMLAARYPDRYAQDIQNLQPANSFQRELIGFLNGSFSKDDGMEHYSAEQRDRLFLMQAHITDKISPKSAQADVMNALIARLAEIDGVLKKAATKNHERQAANPKLSLGQMLAATSIMESGSPADPTTKNWAGCYGYLQYCYWDDRAAKYLGDRNAPKTTANQTVVAVKEWTEVLNQLGSGDAAMAAWLKGAAVGRAVAGRDKRAYDRATQEADGNGTTVQEYMSTIENYSKRVNVNKQLPFLKEVIKQHPNAVDWSLLDRKYPLYSHHRLRQLNPPKPHPERKSAPQVKGAINLGMRKAYVNGHGINTRLYAIKGFKSSSEESQPGSAYYVRGANGNVIVGAGAVRNVVAMVNAAHKDHLNLEAVSSYRSTGHQTHLWRAYGKNRNVVAPPRHSGHENPRKAAIDFKIGSVISTGAFGAYNRLKPVSRRNPRVAPKSEMWRWLVKNAPKYGYKQYWNEPWHWSRDGS